MEKANNLRTVADVLIIINNLNLPRLQVYISERSRIYKRGRSCCVEISRIRVHLNGFQRLLLCERLLFICSQDIALLGR